MVEKKIKIGVLFGGRSGEHEISLLSAESVLSALDPAKYTITQIGISKRGTWLMGDKVLQALRTGEHSLINQATTLPDPHFPGVFHLVNRDGAAQLDSFTDLDVIFPVLHGTFGEDGTIQGLLELVDLAYVGAGVLGSALAMDKAVFKLVMQASGVPVLESVLAKQSELQTNLLEVVDRAENLAPYPLFTKPANMGSSVGITKCRNRSDLMEGIIEASQFDRRILIERGLEQAREIEVSVLGNDHPAASVAGEVIPYGDFYSYTSKYIDDRSQLVIPAPISDEFSAKIREMAIQAFLAIDCAGLARVDFLVDQNTGEVFLNEINSIPGFTQISMYSKLWEATGLPYPELVDRLILLALDRKRERDAITREYK